MNNGNQNFNSRQGLTAVRALKSFIVGGGSYTSAEAYAASQNWGDTPNVITAIKGSVSASSLADGASLVGVNAADLLPLIRAREIISRLPGIRRVPFDIHLTAQSAFASASWVGAGASAPVTKQGYSASTTLTRMKTVSLAVVDAELARSSDPAAEQELSRDFSGAVISASDIAFIDPSNAGVSGAKPAAVTYGSPQIAIGGASVADLDAGLLALQTSLTSHGSTLEFAAYVMHPNTLGAIALMRGSGGDLAYPQVNVKSGGFIGGIPVISSASVPYDPSPLVTSITLLDSSRIWLADNDDLRFDMARHAAIEMVDAPTNDANTPTASQMVSMTQTDSVALRGTRTVNFAIANAGAAAVLTGVPY